MSDLRLRELERRWQQTQTVEDETALLRERARVGELCPIRLRVASSLGHPAARLVAPHPQLPLSFDGFDFLLHESGHPDWAPWRELLDESGRETAARMALPLGELGLAACRARVPLPRAAPVPDLEAVLEAARAWVDEPSPAQRDAVESALQVANTLVVNDELMWAGTNTVLSAASVVTEAVYAPCLREAVWWYATPAESPDEVRLRGAYQAIVASVVPWALA